MIIMKLLVPLFHFSLMKNEQKNQEPMKLNTYATASVGIKTTNYDTTT